MRGKEAPGDALEPGNKLNPQRQLTTLQLMR
jgi:hypothetical protein